MTMSLDLVALRAECEAAIPFKARVMYPPDVLALIDALDEAQRESRAARDGALSMSASIDSIWDEARAIALEEAAQMARDHFATGKPEHLVGALTGLATLPPTLVAVPVGELERRDAVNKVDRDATMWVATKAKQELSRLCLRVIAHKKLLMDASERLHAINSDIGSCDAQDLERRIDAHLETRDHSDGFVAVPVETIEKAIAGLQMILPQAKAWAHEHQVGANQEKVECAVKALALLENVKP